MAINTHSDLRVFLKKQFDANWEYKIGVTELLQLSENITNGSNLDPLLKRRAEMLLADQRDTPFVCFNAEAVVFGLLEGPDSAHLSGLCFVHLSGHGRSHLTKDFHITKFIKHAVKYKIDDEYIKI